MKVYLHPFKDKPLEANTIFGWLRAAMQFAVVRGNALLRPTTAQAAMARAAIKVYCQERAEDMGESVNRRKQANTLAREDIIKLVKELNNRLVDTRSMVKKHRQRAAVLALIFSYGAPCRVGDLSHTRWWSFKIRTDEDGRFLRMQPAWLKNSPKVRFPFIKCLQS